MSRGFRRFYAVFNKMHHGGDSESHKCEIVRQWTWGRTEHLREMTEREYVEMCEALERLVDPRGKERWLAEQKKLRSSALHQLQKYGVDTTDWTKVNAFCQDARIAGKPFKDLNFDELAALTRKMRAINHKRENEQIKQHLHISQ